MKPRLKPGLSFTLLAAALIVVPWILRWADMEYCLTQLTMSLYYAIVVLGL